VAKRDPMLDKLNKMYDEAKGVKDLVSKERSWDDANELIRGRQLPPDHPKYKPEAVLNLLRPIINRKVSMLTDTKPRFSVQPTVTGTGRAKAAKLLDEVANAWWDDQGIDMGIVRALLYAQAFGIAITQTRWSPAEQEVKVDIVDPRNFYVDPYILTPDQLSDAEYVVLEETPPLAQVKLRFGAAADEMVAWSPPNKTEQGGAVKRALRKLSGPFSAKGTGSAVPRALLRHFWIKDYTYEDVEVTKDGKTFTVRKQKYPGGRYIVWGHDDVILHDKPNPYYDGLHPFDMMDWYMDLDSPWGDSEVCTHKSPQLLLNKLAELIAENAMLMNNAIWICDNSAFPNTDGPDGWGQLTNAAGAVIRKRQGTEVKREYPGGVPGSTMQMLNFLQQFIEHTGGTPDIMSKGKAGNVQSGLGIEALQMNAAAPIRLSARVLEALISRIGQKYISRVIQFYPDERMFHIADPGKDGGFKEYLWIRKHFRNALDSASLRDAHRDFRFHVAPGSSLSLTKIQRGLMAVQLYQLGCVDRQSVLEAVEWPDWAETLQRTIKEQLMGLEPGGPMAAKGKKGGGKKGPVERQAKIAGRM
jgi:hypothetical protein